MIDEPKAVEKIAPGDKVESPEPGDFFLIHRTKFFSKLIQRGQNLQSLSWWDQWYYARPYAGRRHSLT